MSAEHDMRGRVVCDNHQLKVLHDLATVLVLQCVSADGETSLPSRERIETAEFNGLASAAMFALRLMHIQLDALGINEAWRLRDGVRKIIANTGIPPTKPWREFELWVHDRANKIVHSWLP